MSGGLGIRLLAFVIAVAMGVSVVFAWRADRQDKAQLQAELRAAQAALQAASVRQETRDAELQNMLAKLEKQRQR